MTAKTSQKLADALRGVGLEALALRAEQDEFHDYLSPHALPEIMLASLLAHAIQHTSDGTQRFEITKIRQMLIMGEYDASTEESDEWAASEEGQAALRMFGIVERGE